MSDRNEHAHPIHVVLALLMIPAFISCHLPIIIIVAGLFFLSVSTVKGKPYKGTGYYDDRPWSDPWS